MIVLFLMATRRFEIAWQLLTAFVISGLIAQAFKFFIYSPRPKNFFPGKKHIYLINGINIRGQVVFLRVILYRFFALVTILALCAKNKKTCLIYLIVAILVAYSRIYLSRIF